MSLVTFPAGRAEDILVVRSASRALGRVAGLDESDQVRLATALSEIARDVLHSCADSAVHFDVTRQPRGEIVVSFVCRASTSPLSSSSAGIAAARRLVDAVEVTTEPKGEQVVRVVKALPHGRPLPPADQIVTAIRTAVPPSPMEEIWNQNRELAAALDELHVRQEQTLQLNAELEETNRGVMAMYNQLSEELEETNRGVVALYAELDDKSLQLQEASQAKARFFAAVSHELRSPVNSVLGLARSLADDHDAPLTAERRHEVQLIQSAAISLLDLVSQLLDIAKAEAGRIEADVAPFDMRALAAELRGLLRPMIDEQEVELRVEVDDDLPPIESDRTLVAQVLRNLLVNAARFTERGDITLRICTSDSSQHVICEVVDTGIGIADEHIERIFEEFFQVRGPLQAKSRGTGLGLAHSQRLVAVLGGELAVRSEVGVGSSFTVTLPVRWNSVTTSPATIPRDLGPSRDVLIVDDDEAFRTALRGMLQHQSHQVTEAEGGDAALAWLEHHRPDLVFLDLRMPDRDGVEVLASMRGNPRLREVPAIVVTSVELTVDTRATLGHATALVAKSEITPERVREIVAEHATEPS